MENPPVVRPADTAPAELQRLAAPWPSTPWGLAALAGGAYVLLFALWTVFHWGGEENVRLISDVAPLPVSLFAAVAAWNVSANSSMDPRLRRAWLLLGLAIVSQFAGDAVWAYIELVLESDPFPSLADVFYLFFYPLSLWGLLSLPGAPISRSERVKFGLDVIIVLVVAWMLVWYFVIGPAADSQPQDLLTQFVAAAYPIGDLVLMGGLVVILFRRPEPVTRSALVLFMAGLVCYVGADLTFGNAQMLATYEGGGPPDLGWMLAYFFYALAAIRQPFLFRGSTSERLSLQVIERLSLWLPFVAIGIGYGLLIVVPHFSLLAEPRLQGVLAGVALLTVAVLVRQAVTLRENLRLNDALRAFSVELEQRVEQRTRELQDAQQALFASQKLASVGTLAAGVAHEVSNPLSVILMAAVSLQDRAEEGDLSPEVVELFVPAITRSVEQATRIVQALRTYSRGSTPELAAQDLNEVVGDALLLLDYQLRTWRGVKVNAVLASARVPVLCDRNQIAQVLINLLNNARDAMPAGGTIAVRTLPVPGGGVLEVTDEGEGIPSEALDKIFDPFYTTKEIGKGSGLGLSIVSGIVRAHQGTIAARNNTSARGATFTVTLPRPAEWDLDTDQAV